MHNLTSFNIDSHFNKERVKKRVVELNYALKVTIVFEVDCYRKKTHTHIHTKTHTHTISLLHPWQDPPTHYYKGILLFIILFNSTQSEI